MFTIGLPFLGIWSGIRGSNPLRNSLSAQYFLGRLCCRWTELCTIFRPLSLPSHKKPQKATDATNSFGVSYKLSRIRA